MNRLTLMLVLAATSLVALAFALLPAEADAAGPFLFPRIAANRLNAQARAVNAQANLNAAIFNAHAFVAKQPKIVVAAPVAVHAAFVPRASVVYFGAPQAIVAPIYAPPAHATSAFSVHAFAGVGGYAAGGCYAGF